MFAAIAMICPVLVNIKQTDRNDIYCGKQSSSALLPGFTVLSCYKGGRPRYVCRSGELGEL